jgi:hypothetical protein
MNSRQVAYQIDVQVEVHQKVRGVIRRVLENQIHRVIYNQNPHAGGQLWIVEDVLREQAKEEHNGR